MNPVHIPVPSFRSAKRLFFFFFYIFVQLKMRHSKLHIAADTLTEYLHTQRAVHQGGLPKSGNDVLRIYLQLPTQLLGNLKK